MTKIYGEIHTGTEPVIAQRINRQRVSQSVLAHEESLDVSRMSAWWSKRGLAGGKIVDHGARR
jgi:hypothetical protein